tara:strand:- start:235330 stop:235848 length:519 start_codon:yes stop_codon:yes gene_type:complete
MSEPTELDFDDDATFDAWCAVLRAEIEAYLTSECYEYGKILDWPAWNIAPHVAMWAIESSEQPGYVGGWVLCGNLPMDYIEGDNLKNPREAMAAIAARWQDFVDKTRRGESTEGVAVESGDDPEQMLAMMESRIGILLEIVADDEAWEEDIAGEEDNAGEEDSAGSGAVSAD